MSGGRRCILFACGGPVAALALAATMALVGACREQSTRGQLVLSVESDMALPRDVDTVRLEVLVRGALQFGNEYAVGERGLLIPATLTLLPGSDPALPVTVRLLGKRQGVVRTLRETVTTVPSDRAASVRMPVQWLCDESVRQVEGRSVSSCAEGYTCSAGTCVPAPVPVASLPTYRPEDIFGGAAKPGAGTCFDTVACMGAGVIATPDANCTIPKPSGGRGINIAMRVPGEGICDETTTVCFVPLDGESASGWRDTGSALALPKAVCDRLRSARVSGVVVSTACPTKTDRTPTCGPWSSVRGSVSGPEGDAGVEGPILVATLLAADAGSGAICCPLLADDRRLYTCVCTGGSSTIDLIGIDPASGGVQKLATLAPRSARARIAAAVRDGAVYWTDRDPSPAVSSTVQMTSLADGRTSQVARIDGDVFDETALLVDDTRLFVLASRVQGAGPDVQLVRVDRATGSTTPFATGSDTAVLDFGQDEVSLYVVSDQDDRAEGAKQWQRRSRIVRLAKADGARSVLAEQSVTTGSLNRGGYLGLRTAGSALYALWEGTPHTDGTVDLQAIRLTGAGSSAATLYAQTIDVGRTSVRMLGVVSGALLLARTELDASDGGSALQSATILLVPASGGAPRIVADFVRDAPVASATAGDGTTYYWVNTSARLFRLPPSALR